MLETIVQLPGSAFRIKRSIMMEEMERDTKLRTHMQDYARFALGQLAQTSACNRLHTLDQRCARWLLIAHDNALADTFPLTHEFLAIMLGVQRSGVSMVLGTLKSAGLIVYVHGRMTILDRLGLEDRACECYADAQLEFERLFDAGDPRRPQNV